MLIRNLFEKVNYLFLIKVIFITTLIFPEKYTMAQGLNNLYQLYKICNENLQHGIEVEFYSGPFAYSPQGPYFKRFINPLNSSPIAPENHNCSYAQLRKNNYYTVVFYHPDGHEVGTIQVPNGDNISHIYVGINKKNRTSWTTYYKKGLPGTPR